MIERGENLDAYVAHYLARLEGPGGGDAFHGLVEAGSKALPLLDEALGHERDSGRRARILEIIWQTRDPRAVPILASALGDAAPEVWRQALDGLVALGGCESAAALRTALSRARRQEIAVPIDWLSEALQQVGAEG